MKKSLIFIVLLMMLSVIVGVSAEGEGARIVVTQLNQDPDPTTPSSYVDVRFKLENYGLGALPEVFVTLDVDSPLILENNEPKSIGTLNSNQKEEEGAIVKFRVRVDSSAVEGEVPVTLLYKSGEDGSWIQKEGFTVDIQSSNKILSIETYKTAPERFKAGEKGNVQISLKNLADSDLKDIKVKITTDDDILPIDNTNEKVIAQLDRGVSQTVIFNVITSSTTGTGIYSLPVTLTYKDFSDNVYTVTNTISVIVDNQPELYINLDETSIRKAGTKGTVLVSISNSGVSDLKFVSYEIKESDQYRVLSTPFVYIGNIDSDDFETVESEIFVKDDVEDVILNVELRYKDNFNKDYQLIKEIPLKIYSQEDLIKYGYETPENKSNIFLVVVAVVILMIYWLFQLIDLLKKKMPLYRKILWLIMFIVGLPLGALMYQFFGKGRGTD